MTDPIDPARLRQMRRAIRKLPRLQREIFLALRFDDALTYSELGERHGLTANQVQDLFARSLVNFMSHLDAKPRRWWRR
jgi:DNA-directed RNA polymerase specialized sigma24 family protein